MMLSATHKVSLLINTLVRMQNALIAEEHVIYNNNYDIRASLSKELLPEI